MKRIAFAVVALTVAVGACEHSSNAVRASLGAANASAADAAKPRVQAPASVAGVAPSAANVGAGTGTKAASSDTTVVVSSRPDAPPPPQPPQGPPPTTTPGPPVSAMLDNPCTTPGGQQTLTVHTAPHDHLYYSTEYADHTNENTPRGYQEGFGPGTSDSTGAFHVTWRVPANAPIGQAVVHYIAEYQAFTINFTIAAVC